MNAPVRIRYQRPKLYDKQRLAIFDPLDFEGNTARFSLIEASAQPLDCLVQTPSGPRRFGDLKVGDLVLSVNGQPTRVTGVFPKGVQDVYRITFSDGAVTRASGDHLWPTIHPRDGYRVMTTDKIRSYSEKSLRLMKFPTCDPIQYEHKPVPISPWLVGALIGDGCLCQNALSISSADDDLLDRVRREVPKGYILNQANQYGWNIVAASRGAGYEQPCIRFKANGYEVYVAKKYGGRAKTHAEALEIHARMMREQYGDNYIETNLRVELRSLGLLDKKAHEKFIPDILKYNSVDVRLEVLRGVMDTDGSACKEDAGTCVIEQTSERLANDIVEIVRSLGGLSSLVAVPLRQAGWKQAYRVNFALPTPSDAFWLERKRSRMRAKSRLLRKITSIERIEDAEVQCIAVDHPTHLYLTDDCIVTHNTKAGKTAGCTAWLVEQGVFGRPGDNFQWVAPVYGQAKIAFRRIKRGIRANIRQASAIDLEPKNPSPFNFAKPNESELFIELFNGSTLWFKSAEKPDNLYGEDVHAAVLDEASRMREESWHAVRSTLTATRGKARMIGNVKGRSNWFYKLARKAQMGAKGLSFHRITAFDAVAAGVLDMEEIEEARARLPENVFRELYMAEASEDDTNPFGYSHIEACLHDISDNEPVCIGIDLAKSSDWTVVIALDRSMRVCGFERWQAPWRETKARIAALVGKTPCLVDETGVGNPVVEDLQSVLPNVQGFMFNQSSKQRLMETLVVEIQQHRLGFPDGLIRQELDTFEYEHVRNGVRYTAPAGYHDDCVCSLALAALKFRQLFPVLSANVSPAEIIRVSPWLGVNTYEDTLDAY